MPGYPSKTVGAGIAFGLALFATLVGLALADRLAGRFGWARLKDLSPRQRRLMALAGFVYLILTLVVAWSFTNGHPAVGIAVLVAAFVVPHFVQMPFRIRRSRRAAEAARARRLARRE